MIENTDSLKKLKELKDYSLDIIFADPPYALGSEIKIENNVPIYKKNKDFMNKWKMPDEKYWESFFKTAYKKLKYGGRILFFGMDRQLFLFQYYAVKANFNIQQSLYWFYLSNFPKGVDLSKQIDKKQKKKRISIGIRNDFSIDNIKRNIDKHQNHIENVLKSSSQKYGYKYKTSWEVPVTKSNSELGKKYEGYKYANATLKQVLETIMVFQKPLKTNSYIDDILLYENGDNTISPSIWNIDENKVLNNNKPRYPSQLFIERELSNKIDKQSGILKSGFMKKGTIKKSKNQNCYNKYDTFISEKEVKQDKGYCTRILEKIDLLNEETDLIIYCSKISPSERNFGIKNNHPTLKPIKLIYKIAKLLKTPNKQNIFIPFAGTGSEIIGFQKAGFNNIIATEINNDYTKIGNKRIKEWKNIDFEHFLQKNKIKNYNKN